MIYLKKDFLILFILIPLLLACSNERTEAVADFEMHKLVEDFSSGLKDNDSVYIDINLSVDLEHGSASVLLSKENNQLFLNTLLVVDDELKKLGKVKYSVPEDSLCFETIFKYMSKNEKLDKKNSVVCTVKYRGDSLSFYSLDHINHMKNVGYFYSLLYRYYPNESEFQPVYPPSE